MKNDISRVSADQWLSASNKAVRVRDQDAEADARPERREEGRRAAPPPCCCCSCPPPPAAALPPRCRTRRDNKEGGTTCPGRRRVRGHRRCQGAALLVVRRLVRRAAAARRGTNAGTALEGAGGRPRTAERTRQGKLHAVRLARRHPVSFDSRRPHDMPPVTALGSAVGGSVQGSRQRCGLGASTQSLAYLIVRDL